MDFKKFKEQLNETGCLDPINLDKRFFDLIGEKIETSFDGICGDFDEDGFHFKTMSDGGIHDERRAILIEDRMKSLGIKSERHAERCNWMSYEDLYKFLEMEKVGDA